MKNLIILLFLSFSCFAQTKLDTLVFNKINEYRVSKGLNKVSWDTVCFKASKHHSEYLERKAFKTKYDTITCGHEEKVSGFEHCWDRYGSYGGKLQSVGEIVETFNESYKDSEVSFLDRMADSILVHWKNSSQHNAIILGVDFAFIGVSCVVIKRPVGLRGKTNYSVWSTCVFSGGGIKRDITHVKSSKKKKKKGFRSFINNLFK